MTAVGLVGFFSELPHGQPDGPSLRAALRDDADPLEPEIVAYLRGGATLATTGRMADDVISSEEDIAPLAILTDGEWMWPADLAYYVETYHVRLPQDFIEHIASQGWEPPSLSRAQLSDVERRARGR